METEADERDERLGIQSVEIAAQVLQALITAGRAVPLKDLARLSGMHPGKVHRYLVSLVRSGLMAQDPISGHYGVGPMAVALGLTGLRSTDLFRLASAELPRLRDAIDETVILVIWNAGGPVVVDIEESARPVYMNIRVGSILPVVRSATGAVLAAHMPAEAVAPVLAAEREAAGTGNPLYRPEAVDALFDRLRRDRLAAVQGLLVNGVNAIAAPVFDHKGRAVAAVGALGRSEELDVSPQGTVARELSQVARQISQRLGFSEDGKAN
jgi:DNA-binding IclR family transcriptional regulator